MEQTRKTRRATGKYKEKAKHVKASEKKDKNEWYENLAKKAQECADRGNMRELFKKVKLISGKSSKRVALPVKDKEGKLITDEKRQNERWKEHFQIVLNLSAPTTVAKIDEPTDELDITTESFNIDEVQKAIKMMKNNKAPGIDLISAEVLKEGGDEVSQWIL
eukprot:gene11858-2404_t